MKTRLAWVGLFLAWGWYACATEPARPVAGRFIVTLKPEASVSAGAQEHGLTPHHVYSGALRGWSGEIPFSRLKALADDPNVASIVPDSPLGIFEAGCEGSSSAEAVPAGVARIGAAPGTSEFSGAGVGVAVLDTGLDLNQPDLHCSSNYFSAYGPRAADDNGHGTHVAGIIAGIGAAHSVFGVAPGAVLYAVKVLDSHGNGFDSDVIAGLNWVLENASRFDPPIKVVNMSFGRPASEYDSALRAAVENVVAAGITVVVAAGNDPAKRVQEMAPAGFADVIAVASTTASQGAPSLDFGCVPEDAASFFTTSGAMDSSGRGIAISAPGEEREDITPDWVTSVGIVSTRLGGGTARMSGTSMAAPHVAGAVALLYEKAVRLGVALNPANAKLAVMNGDRIGVAPLDTQTSRGYRPFGFDYDGEREGILSVPSALSFIDRLEQRAAPPLVRRSTVLLIGTRGAR